jgi:2',3'-cyclic-nucleotide 2'-phosphodiesterase (5'-nucleotidase family)
LPQAVAQYAADRDFLDGWDAAADPATLTAADGARLLAAARYPLVSILWTTDFHGAFQLRERDRDTNRPLGSSAVLAAYLARERARNLHGTLLLDGGDCFQGTMLSNLSYGRPVIVQMNRLGYDASAVGNHEFDWTVDTLVARVRQARFPFLSANLFEKRRGQLPPWVKPYEVFERHGVRIAVLGFSTVETPTTTLPHNVVDYEFRQAAAIAREWLPKLRTGGADAVVLMGHLPGSQDSAGTRFRGELAELGRAVEGEDALLGGHSHNFVNG